MDESVAPPVDDDEILYRSVLLTRANLRQNEDGNWVVTSHAFSDRNLRPSLYRHLLCENPPFSNPPRMGAEQPVVSLTARSIRQGVPELPERSIDVVPDTSNNQHPSHCVVIGVPEITKNPRRVFDKLKERLARIARHWAISPTASQIENLPEHL